MLLVIDIGNTHTRFGLFKEDVLTHTWHLTTDIHRTHNQYYTFLLKSFNNTHVGIKDISGVCISCVVPRVLPILKMFCDQFFDLKPLIIDDGALKLGYKVRTKDPAEIKADILANIAACNEKYGPSVLMIDMGSATTIVPTDVAGNIVGSVITPGLGSMYHSLTGCEMPHSSLLPDRVMGKNRESAIQRGIFFGYIDMMNGLIGRIFNEARSVLPIVITGGSSRIIAPYIDLDNACEPNLTLQGMQVVYRMNAINDNVQRSMHK